MFDSVLYCPHYWLRLKACDGIRVNVWCTVNIWTIKGILKYLHNYAWQLNRCSCFVEGWVDQTSQTARCRPSFRLHLGETLRHSESMQWCILTPSNNGLIFKFVEQQNKTTSLTNHWQKAGPIHSRAWTPQSIHTAFFWGRFLFPSWRETRTVSFQSSSVREAVFSLRAPRGFAPTWSTYSGLPSYDFPMENMSTKSGWVRFISNIQLLIF